MVFCFWQKEEDDMLKIYKENNTIPRELHQKINSDLENKEYAFLYIRLKRPRIFIINEQ